MSLVPDFLGGNSQRLISDISWSSYFPYIFHKHCRFHVDPRFWDTENIPRGACLGLAIDQLEIILSLILVGASVNDQGRFIMTPLTHQLTWAYIHFYIHFCFVSFVLRFIVIVLNGSRIRFAAWLRHGFRRVTMVPPSARAWPSALTEICEAPPERSEQRTWHWGSVRATLATSSLTMSYAEWWAVNRHERFEVTAIQHATNV